MSTKGTSLHAVVVVLGDLGRSPRMMYHVLSLLEAGHHVSFVGYTGVDLIPALQHAKYAERLHVVRFTAPKVKILKTHALLFYYAWRIASLTVMLTRALFWQVAATSGNRAVDFVLVQNPPAIPLLFLATLYCRFWTSNPSKNGRAKLVIDWHNVGYSMISLGGPVRAVARWYERSMAPFADAHVVVTQRMKQWLQEDLRLIQPCQVLHDSPPVMFRLRTLKEQHTVLQQYVTPAIQKATTNSAWQVNSENGAENGPSFTLFTEAYDKGRRFRERAGRPALIVSSTSWTPDEDIQLLLDSLQAVDEQITSSSNSNFESSLRIVCAITGKGPLKEHYERVISQMKLSNVLILTLWLHPPDYPKLLACADLGVSLHTSTSGMDLPIKILDYFGCEVPVCAYQFECLHELVQDNVNGRTFCTAPQLAALLWELLSPLQGQHNNSVGNHDFGDLKRYSLQIQGRALWSENWPKYFKPLLEEVVGSKDA